ncbi:MAG: MmgE/PrpD family protein [Alphaproteobacteria bacterium]
MHKTQSSVTERLVSLILEKPVTDRDRAQAALFVLDTVANALAARHTDPARRVRAWWRTLSPGRADALADPGREAFLTGALAHTLETDDLHRASVLHPGCVVVPAAWASARARGASGRAFLDAVVRGYDAACRIGMAAGTEHYKIWHNTATIGPFGSAMAAGLLMDLDAAGLVNALGNAGTQSSGLWEFLESGAMTKHLHAGRAAEAGWLAAGLAAQGFTGPRTILEGARGFFAATCPNGRADAVLDGPERPWQIHDNSMKPWPSCRHTHPAMDAAQDLRRQIKAHGADIGDITMVHVRTYQAAMDVTDRISPRTDYQAKFSMQHCVAAALSRDLVTFDAFGEEARRDLASLRARVSLIHDEALDQAYPRAWGGTVSLSLKDGSRLDAVRAHAKGDPEAPLSASELARKSRMLMAHGNIHDADLWIEVLLSLSHAPSLPDLKSVLLA